MQTATGPWRGLHFARCRQRRIFAEHRKSLLEAVVERVHWTVAWRQLKGTQIMLFTIAIILFVAWLLGLVTSYTLGGFLHILLVLAIIMLLVGVIQGRRGV
jgi:hypothetical protein